ncbi:hypothetical protein PSPO01_13416 [Paraphaeosphaeria sporulosa]
MHAIEHKREKVDPVPSNERCCICLRDFDDPPDLADNEPPCKPMQLHPCGHLVGDRCHAKLDSHHQGDCLLSTSLVTYTTPVLKMLSIICKMDHLSHVSPVGLLSDAPRFSYSWLYFRRDDFLAIHEHLIANGVSDMQAQLFNRGAYTKREAFSLWFTHLKFLFMYLTTVTLPCPELHDYVLGCLVGGATGIAATVLGYWKNSRILAPHLERAVQPCVLICGMAFELWLTANAKAMHVESGIKASIYFLLTPFVLHAVLYAFVAGWLIHLGWRHRMPTLVWYHRGWEHLGDGESCQFERLAVWASRFGAKLQSPSRTEACHQETGFLSISVPGHSGTKQLAVVPEDVLWTQWPVVVNVEAPTISNAQSIGGPTTVQQRDHACGDELSGDPTSTGNW